MLLETTYRNKKNKALINDLVGKPFSILNAIKLKGIGSKRMIIEDVSPNLKKVINSISDVNYGSIELRPNGILIAINKGLQNFTWAIPYYQFYLYNTNGISIHAQGKFVHFRNNRTHQENASFFKKLMRLKVEYDQRFPHVDSIQNLN
ncbi:arginyl-tRNA synthetase [Aquimarina latercula]|nr:arginyl-tRNA synthetase [Aquimarina latercula]